MDIARCVLTDLLVSKYVRSATKPVFGKCCLETTGVQMHLLSKTLYKKQRKRIMKDYTIDDIRRTKEAYQKLLAKEKATDISEFKLWHGDDENEKPRFFTDNKKVAEYFGKGRASPYRLTIKKPFVFDFEHNTWDNLVLPKKYLDELGIEEYEFVEEDENLGRVDTDTFSYWILHGNKLKGIYDGVIMLNVGETETGHIIANDYVVKYPEQAEKIP